MTDERYRWVIVGYTLIIQAVTVGTLIYCFALFAVPWIDQFADSRAQVMLIISLLQLLFGLLGPFAGHAMDRLRLRTIVMVGVGCYALGFLLLAQATALWQIYVLFATLFPAAMVLMGTLVSQTLVTRWFTDKRGTAIGVSSMGTSIGGIAFPLLVAWWLAETGSWRDVAHALFALAIIVVAPLTWVVLRRRSPSETKAESGLEEDDYSILAVVTSAAFLIPIGALVPLNLAFGAIQFNLGAYASDLGHADFAGSLIAISSGSMIVGKVLFGALSDRVRHRYLYWLAAGFMLVALFLLSGAPLKPLMITGVAFVGLAGGGILPIMAVIIGARFPIEQFGRVMGLVMLSLSLASLGPLIAGWVYDQRGSYDPAFVLFAILLVPAIVAMIWLPPPRK